MPCPSYRRKRTISKAFRVSREESERIELLAKAAGVTQQEYIIADYFTAFATPFQTSLLQCSTVG